MPKREKAKIKKVTFEKTPFTNEESRTYTFGDKELQKDVERTMLELNTFRKFPEAIISHILEYSHPNLETFVRMAHICKALGSTKGRQSNSDLRVMKHDVNAFINFKALFSEGIQGIQGNGLITSIKIDATQIHGKRNFARSLEINIETNIKMGYNKSISWKRTARLEPIKNWKILPKE
jgi:hypothetical protein